MAVAAYTTDLTVIVDMDGTTGTAAEPSSVWSAGRSPINNDTDFTIQGAQHASLTFNATGKGGIVVTGSSRTWTSGHYLFGWIICTAPGKMLTKAAGGLVMLCGDSVGDLKVFYVGGSDYGKNPYGGWANFAVDPEGTQDELIGSPSDYYVIGGGCQISPTKVDKGNPIGFDVFRYGRGEIRIVGGTSTDDDATFLGMATANDDTNARWGLFQYENGSYLWKGLMYFGYGNPTDFTDSNRNIIVDDVDQVAATFNKIEIHNASSIISWTNISISSLSSVSPGDFEMVDNATFVDIGGVFTDMGTFIYQSNADLTGRTFRRCGLVTTGGGDFDACVFEETSDATKAVIASSPANAALLINCTFASTGTGHGLEIGGTAANLTLTGCVFTGYDTANPGTAANKAIYVNIATGTVNLTVSGGSGVTLDHHVRSAGATVNVIAGAVTVQATCVRTNGTAFEDIRVFGAASAKSVGTATTDTANKLVDTNATFQTDGVATDDVAFNQTDGTSATITAVDSETSLSLSSDAFPDGNEDYRVGGVFPAKDPVTIANSGTTATVTHAGHGMASNDYVYIEGGSLDANEGVYQITYISTSSYSYTMLSTPGSSPTGTITATFVALYGTSDVNGKVSTSRIYSVAQPVTGWARNITAGSPYYQEGIITGTISTSLGLTATAVLVLDE